MKNFDETLEIDEDELITNMAKANVKKIFDGLSTNAYKNLKKTPSEKFRKKRVLHFNKDEIKVTKCGKTYKVQDRIQSFEHDTNFYKVMEDYNCTVSEAVERMKSNIQELQGVLNFGTSYAESLMAVENAKKQFEMLPAEIKAKFGNNIENFMKNGQSFINELKNKYQKSLNEGDK